MWLDDEKILTCRDRETSLLSGKGDHSRYETADGRRGGRPDITGGCIEYSGWIVVIDGVQSRGSSLSEKFLQAIPGCRKI